MRRLPMIVSGTALVLFGYFLGSTNSFAPQLLRAESESKASENPAADVSNTEKKQGDENPAAGESQPAVPARSSGPSPLTLEKIKIAYDALVDASDALAKEGYYASATTEVNVFGVLSGGVNAIADLQSGNGVDPETFAAIYAGSVKPEVEALLQRDPDNRYTYDGKLVQMYPVSELRRRFLIRARLTGQIQPAAEKTTPEGTNEKPEEPKK